jgi:hypothetical protein
LAAFISRTDANASGAGDHRRTIVEAATDVNLRQTFALTDGDLVEIEVGDDSNDRSAAMLAWALSLALDDPSRDVDASPMSPDPSEHFESLPKRRVGAGALLLDGTGNVLMVEPVYKDHWEIPGGTVENGKTLARRASASASRSWGCGW